MYYVDATDVISGDELPVRLEQRATCPVESKYGPNEGNVFRRQYVRRS